MGISRWDNKSRSINSTQTFYVYKCSYRIPEPWFTTWLGDWAKRAVQPVVGPGTSIWHWVRGLKGESWKPGSEQWLWWKKELLRVLVPISAGAFSVTWMPSIQLYFVNLGIGWHLGSNIKPSYATRIWQLQASNYNHELIGKNQYQWISVWLLEVFWVILDQTTP